MWAVDIDTGTLTTIETDSYINYSIEICSVHTASKL